MVKATDLEELLYAIRIYTAGYRMYTLPVNVLFHYYLRNDSPKVWQNPSFYEDNRKTLRAVKRMLLLENDKEKENKDPVKKIDYTVDIEDVKKYYERFQIDVVNKKLVDWCANYKL